MNTIKPYSGRSFWLTGLMLTVLLTGCGGGNKVPTSESVDNTTSTSDTNDTNDTTSNTRVIRLLHHPYPKQRLEMRLLVWL